MSFSIEFPVDATEDVREFQRVRVGRITLGYFTEEFEAYLDYWSSVDYEAQRDIREGFGRGRDGGAGGGFAAVGDEGDGGSEKCGQQLVLGRKLGRGAVGEESGDRDADESVQGIPDEIEGGDFVGEEFEDEERGTGGNDGPGGEELQSGREREMSAAGEQAEDGDGGVEIQAGGESDGGEEREEFGGRDLEDVEHGVGETVSRGREFWSTVGLPVRCGEKQVPHRAFSPVRNDKVDFYSVANSQRGFRGSGHLPEIQRAAPWERPGEIFPAGLQRGLDLEAPGFQEGLGDVLGILVAAGPLAQAGRPEVLVGRKLVLAHNLLEFGDGGGNRADGLRLAPVGISATLGHKKCLSGSGDETANSSIQTA